MHTIHRTAENRNSVIIISQNFWKGSPALENLGDLQHDRKWVLIASSQYLTFKPLALLKRKYFCELEHGKQNYLFLKNKLVCVCGGLIFINVIFLLAALST